MTRDTKYISYGEDAVTTKNLTLAGVIVGVFAIGIVLIVKGLSS